MITLVITITSIATLVHGCNNNDDDNDQDNDAINNHNINDGSNDNNCGTYIDK